MKLWGGRFESELDQAVHKFSSSIQQDSRMWASDIQGSIAHAEMLEKTGVIGPADASAIIHGLRELSAEFSQAVTPAFRASAEDIHSEIESLLTQKIGAAAGRLHTARSRNDQVATDLRLYLREESSQIQQLLTELLKTLLNISESHFQSVMPGLTHMQHAQPVSLAHHLLAYFWMFLRDRERLQDSMKRLNQLPLGSAALAGTGFPIDREMVKEKLAFDQVIPNSLDAVSDRDFVIEFLSFASITQMHLSRMAEELILWSTPEFGFIEMADDVTTGSSIMPQKKNPDVAELIRGKTGRVYGALMGSLTLMKSLPLSYNRDQQEDKVHLFEGLDTLRACLQMMNLILNKTDFKTDRMAQALVGDFSNATDLADDLVRKGLTFREAHEVTGKIVQFCLKNKKILEDLSLEELKACHPLCDLKTKNSLQHLSVLSARISFGGTAPSAVQAQWKQALAALGE